MIAALTRNRVIGRANALPFHLPNDLRHFRRMTVGKPCIMGRGTFASIGDKPLPRRPTIVVSRSLETAPAGVQLARSCDEALALARPCEEAMVCGGESLYTLFLDRADRLYLTHVETELPGDRFFPAFDASDWQEVERRECPADAKHRYAYTFQTLDRIR